MIQFVVVTPKDTKMLDKSIDLGGKCIFVQE